MTPPYGANAAAVSGSYDGRGIFLTDSAANATFSALAIAEA